MCRGDGRMRRGDGWRRRRYGRRKMREGRSRRTRRGEEKWSRMISRESCRGRPIVEGLRPFPASPRPPLAQWSRAGAGWRFPGSPWPPAAQGPLYPGRPQAGRRSCEADGRWQRRAGVSPRKAEAGRRRRRRGRAGRDAAGGVGRAAGGQVARVAWV